MEGFSLAGGLCGGGVEVKVESRLLWNHYPVKELNNNLKAVTGSLLVDGTGEEGISDGVLIMEGEMIREVGQRDEVRIPRGAAVYDGTGLTIMPGLVDAHVHLTGSRRGDIIGEYDAALHVARAISDARNMLEHGVTAARCCGSQYTPSIKRAVEEGTIEGPRLVASGPYISQTFGHGDIHHLPFEWVRDIRVIADGVGEGHKGDS